MDKSRLRIAAFAVGAMLLAPAGAQAAPTRLAGTDVVGTHVSSAEPGRAEVYRTSATETGDTSSISVHLDATSTASSVEVGLYADAAGQPTTLLTSGRTSSPVAGWNQVTVPTARVQAGERYWIGVLNPIDATGTLSWTDRANGTGGGEEQTAAATDLATLPGTWATGATYSDGPLSAFVTGEPNAPAGPVLGVTPSALSFSATVGAASPSAKTLSIANSGSGSLSYSISESTPWLSVSPTSGTAPGSATVTVNTTGLAAGTYTATIRVAAPGAADAPRDVAVTLTVNAAAGGLVGAWGFNETSGDTVLDSSGKRNTGSIQGATRVDGRFGRGLSFDGRDDWVTIADNASLDLTTGMTLEAWVRPDALGTAWRTILVKEQTGQLAYALYGNNDAGKPSGHVFTSADNGLTGPVGLTEGEWAHVATTWDGSTLRLYVNGLEAASMPLSGTAVTSPGALRIGGNAVWAEWFDGRIDEVRVYNRALSVDQIRADMETPIAKGGGSEMSPLEKLKALLLKLLAKWKTHWGDWTWHGHRGYFHGGR